MNGVRRFSNLPFKFKIRAQSPTSCPMVIIQTLRGVLEYPNGHTNWLKHVALMLAVLLTVPVGIVHADWEPSISAKIGYERNHRQGRYFPIRVTLDWSTTDPTNDQTGVTQAFNGLLQVQIPHNHLYETVTSVPILVEPGRRTEALAYVRAHVYIDSCEIKVTTPRGKEVASTTFDRNSVDQPWPGSEIASEGCFVLTAGDETLSRAGDIFVGEYPGDIIVAPLSRSEFPIAWTGLDGVSALVIGDLGTEGIRAPSVLAIRSWVERGGDLVLLVDAGTESLDQLFPELRDQIHITELTRMPVIDSFATDVWHSLQQLTSFDLDELARLYASGPRTTPTSNEDLEGLIRETQGNRAGFKSAEITIFGPVIQAVHAWQPRDALARRITISETLAQQGWSTVSLRDHPNTSSDQTESNTSPSFTGEMAVGHVGLGQVLIVGASIPSLADGANSPAFPAVWWHLLADVPAFHEYALARSAAQKNSGPRSLRRRSHVNSYRAAQNSIATDATNRILDAMSVGISPPQHLWKIFGVIFIALAILTGPVDFLLLKRLRRLPATWITCPLWVVAACAAISWASASVPVGRSLLRRTVVLDVTPDATTAWKTGITQVLSGRHGRYETTGIASAQFVHPVSHEPLEVWRRSDTAFRRTVSIFQSAERSTVSGLAIAAGRVRWIGDQGPIAVPPWNVSVEPLQAQPLEPDVDQASSQIDLTLRLRAMLPANARITGILVDTRDGVFQPKSTGYDAEWTPSELKEGIELIQRSLGSNRDPDLPNMDFESGFPRYMFSDAIDMRRAFWLPHHLHIGNRLRLIDWTGMVPDVDHGGWTEQVKEGVRELVNPASALLPEGGAVVTLRIEGINDGLGIQPFDGEVEQTTFVRWAVRLSDDSQPDSNQLSRDPRKP